MFQTLTRKMELLEVFSGFAKKKRGIFCTDTVARANYRILGDYVSLDTTFSTNVYDMPFASIIGVDNHGKMILFGCALLRDQTQETFGWLLGSFTEAMGGSTPECI